MKPIKDDKALIIEFNRLEPGNQSNHHHKSHTHLWYRVLWIRQKQHGFLSEF